MPLTHEQTGHPCFGDRPLALAERCERDGLENCAATIRGLLEERQALVRLIGTDHESSDFEEMWQAIEAARALLGSRGALAQSSR